MVDKSQHEMILWLETKRPNGKGKKIKIICVSDDETGGLSITTARGVLKFINEELRHTEAEKMGESYHPNTEIEFKTQKNWPKDYEGE